MADVFTKKKRSDVMSRIRGRGNKDTELALAKLLRAHRITGWRRQIQIRTSPQPSPQRGEGVRVKPDFIFPKARLAVFVDGCFWHGCPKHSNPTKWLRKSSMPVRPASAIGGRTGRTFWRAKLAANQARDRKVNRILRRAGWRIVRVWEHQLQKGEVRSAKGELHPVLRRIERVLDRA